MLCASCTSSHVLQIMTDIGFVLTVLFNVENLPVKLKSPNENNEANFFELQIRHLLIFIKKVISAPKII